MRQKLLLLAAVFFGILAFVITYQQIESEKKRILGEAEEVALIKLTRSMVNGEEIKTSDIALEKVKRLRSPLKNYREIPWFKRELVIGKKLEIPIDKGQTLQWDDLSEELSRQAGLTGIIPKEYRAVSIAVDTTSSVTNLIRPNDHVDIIGTFRFPEMKGDNSLDTITMTILQNVTVLATGSSWNAAANDGKRQGYSTVTLALSPKEVEMIIFAGQKGRLSLSLRNFEETKIETDLQSVNFKYLERNIPLYNAERAKKQNEGR